MKYLKCEIIITLYYWKLFRIKAAAVHGEKFVVILDFRKNDLAVKSIIIKVEDGSLFPICLVTCLFTFSYLCFFGFGLHGWFKWHTFNAFTSDHCMSSDASIELFRSLNQGNEP